MNEMSELNELFNPDEVCDLRESTPNKYLKVFNLYFFSSGTQKTFNLEASTGKVTVCGGGSGSKAAFILATGHGTELAQLGVAPMTFGPFAGVFSYTSKPVGLMTGGTYFLIRGDGSSARIRGGSLLPSGTGINLGSTTEPFNNIYGTVKGTVNTSSVFALNKLVMPITATDTGHITTGEVWFRTDL